MSVSGMRLVVEADTHSVFLSWYDHLAYSTMQCAHDRFLESKVVGSIACKRGGAHGHPLATE